MPKTCKQCDATKGDDKFYVGTQSGENGQVYKYLDSYCKPCRRDYQTRRRQRRKLSAIEYLGGRCVDCGLVDECPDVYDVHHLDPDEKEFSLGRAGGRSFEAIKPELDKCVLICANCHRRRHAH